MAKLNIEKAIENGRKKIANSPYDLTYNSMCEIINRNYGDRASILCDSFCIGITQGIKMAKAEMKQKGAVL